MNFFFWVQTLNSKCITAADALIPPPKAVPASGLRPNQSDKRTEGLPVDWIMREQLISRNLLRSIRRSGVTGLD